MQCNDECCESRDGKRKWRTSALTTKTKEKFGEVNDDLTDEERKRPKDKPKVLEDKVIESQENSTKAHNAKDVENAVSDDLTDEGRKRPKHKPDVLDDKVIASQDNATQEHNVENAEKVTADDLIDVERKRPNPKHDALDDKVKTSQDNTDSITQASNSEIAENGISEDFIDEKKEQPTHKINALDDKEMTSQDNTTKAHFEEDAANAIEDDLTDELRKRPKHKPNVLDVKVTASYGNTDSIAEASNVGNEENVIPDNLFDKEQKRPKDKPSVLDDKGATSQGNTQAHNLEDAENIIVALKKKIKSLQIRLKKKSRPEENDQLDKLLNDSTESNEGYNSTTLNETELSSFDEKDNDRNDPEGKQQSTTTSHDLIDDDDQEPSNFDEGELHNALENNARATLNESSHNEENRASITNNDKEPGVEHDALINDENRIKATQSSSVQITNEVIDDKEKLNKNPAIDIDDLEEKTAQESNDNESSSENNEPQAPSELGLYSLKDSAIDPTEELLDEEAIDDASKFGRKRNLIRKRKKPH